MLQLNNSYQIRFLIINEQILHHISTKSCRSTRVCYNIIQRISNAWFRRIKRRKFHFIYIYLYIYIYIYIYAPKSTLLRNRRSPVSKCIRRNTIIAYSPFTVKSRQTNLFCTISKHYEGLNQFS